MEALSVGDPFDPATEVGPLVTAEAVDKIAAQVEDARAHGATILCGGERVVGPEGPDRPGNFYRPTVITDITPAMRVATEEVFGPVALLYTVADADEALALANHSEFGLGSSVWTTDADEQQQFVSGLQAGQVFVNGMVVSMVRAALRWHQELGGRPRTVHSRHSGVLQYQVGVGGLMGLRAYLDHAATTPMRPEAVEAMLPYLRGEFGNPSGGHTESRRARMAVDEAREQIAELLGVDLGELVFTSGGTEADNLAVAGAWEAGAARSAVPVTPRPWCARPWSTTPCSTPARHWPTAPEPSSAWCHRTRTGSSTSRPWPRHVPTTWAWCR